MISVILAAAGSGKRFGAGKNKALLDLNGQTVLARSVKAFADAFDEFSLAGEFIIVVGNGEIESAKAALGAATAENFPQYPIKFTIGGSERQYSINNGLQAIDEKSETVLVHDAARPLVTTAIIGRIIEAVHDYGAAIAAVPVKNTIKRAAENGFVAETLKRESLWAVQTPQGFQTQIIKAAYEKAAFDGWLGTDDASLVERLGQRVKIILGDYENIKITTPEDMVTAKGILERSRSYMCCEKEIQVKDLSN